MQVCPRIYFTRKKDCLRLSRKDLFSRIFIQATAGNIIAARRRCQRWKAAKRKRRDADGKLVNVGNFDADGANVNRNRPDYSGDYLGVVFSRSP